MWLNCESNACVFAKNNQFRLIMSNQSASHFVMIKPAQFGFNIETAATNSFQQATEVTPSVQQKAIEEFNGLANLLKENNISLTVIDDTIEPYTPDAVFPNNWISTHQNGKIVLYPMQAVNRRLERRKDIVDMLSQEFQVTSIVDYTNFELENRYLEGTGSMVLDRDLRLCYAALSPRTHEILVDKFCKEFGYKKIVFNAFNQGEPIYHTNVILCAGSQFLLACIDSIPNQTEQRLVRNISGKTVIEINIEQLNHFAGNMLEVINKYGERFIVMSEQAYKSLTASQVAQLSMFGNILFSPLYTIEQLGGGSARCMIAEIFLPPKTSFTF
jgi:hypothetical protein